jgi:hypothetical protein
MSEYDRNGCDSVRMCARGQVPHGTRQLVSTCLSSVHVRRPVLNWI